jgi:hypothetical protein
MLTKKYMRQTTFLLGLAFMSLVSGAQTRLGVYAGATFATAKLGGEWSNRLDVKAASGWAASVNLQLAL